MFIFNFKINAGKISKIIFIIILIIVLLLCGIIGYKIFINPSNMSKVNDNINSSEYQTLTNLNYTNVLKEVHDNLDSYVGLKIKFTGFIYRVFDLQDSRLCFRQKYGY